MIDILDKYRKYFREMLQNKTSDVISNEARDHAEIIIQELIAHASTKVEIFCTNFSPDVYSEATKNEIVKALRRGVNVSIKVRNIRCASWFPTEDCNKDKGKFLYVDGFDNLAIPDFCVIDDCSFRVEKSQEERSAFACAYDEDFGKKLSVAFSKIA